MWQFQCVCKLQYIHLTLDTMWMEFERSILLIDAKISYSIMHKHWFSKKPTASVHLVPQALYIRTTSLLSIEYLVIMFMLHQNNITTIVPLKEQGQIQGESKEKEWDGGWWGREGVLGAEDLLSTVSWPKPIKIACRFNLEIYTVY